MGLTGIAVRAISIIAGVLLVLLFITIGMRHRLVTPEADRVKNASLMLLKGTELELIGNAPEAASVLRKASSELNGMSNPPPELQAMISYKLGEIGIRNGADSEEIIFSLVQATRLFGQMRNLTLQRGAQASLSAYISAIPLEESRIFAKKYNLTENGIVQQ